MKRFLATFLAVCFACCAAPLFAKASSEQDGVTVIRWAFWGNETRVQISNEAAKLYEASHPGIKINLEPAGGVSDHFNRIDTQLAGKNGPDIIQMGGNWPDYVKSGSILPLEKYSELDKANIDKSALDAGSINGHLYGVSHGVTYPALVYNKTLLQKIGAPLPSVSMTFDELRAYLVMLKSKLPNGVYPMMDIGSGPNGSSFFGYWLRYNGTPLYKASNNSSPVKASDAQKFIELFKSYRDDGLIPSADIAAAYPGSSTDTDALIVGKAAINFATSNMLSGLQAATKDELALIECPGAVATKALWPQLSAVMTVSKDCKNISEAVKFINFIITSPEAGKILGTNRGFSASPTFQKGVVGTPMDDIIANYIQIAGPHSTPETDHLPNDVEFTSTFYLIWQEVAFGKTTTAQGGQRTYELIQRLISK